MTPVNDDRMVAVPRSVLFEIGRNITSGNLSRACQAIIDILKDDSDAHEETA